MTDILMLAGLALGFIATLAWLEDRAAKRRARHKRFADRIMEFDSQRPTIAPPTGKAARNHISSDLLPWQ